MLSSHDQSEFHMLLKDYIDGNLNLELNLKANWQAMPLKEHQWDMPMPLHFEPDVVATCKLKSSAMLSPFETMKYEWLSEENSGLGENPVGVQDQSVQRLSWTQLPLEQDLWEEKKSLVSTPVPNGEVLLYPELMIYRVGDHKPSAIQSYYMTEPKCTCWINQMLIIIIIVIQCLVLSNFIKTQMVKDDGSSFHRILWIVNISQKKF